MLIRGLRFGMLLQIAIGPIALFIFNTATISGILPTLSGVIGVTLVDGLFILAALFGIGALLEKNKNCKKTLKILGNVVVIIFGILTIISVFGIDLIPNFSFINKQVSDSIFLQAFILTIANPITIIFWAGVFSSKLSDEKMNSKNMYLFGFGALLSTVISLTLITMIGYFTSVFLPQTILNALNIIVGTILIFFGVYSIIKK
jgi:threonine/homoserine/homoserine lactone efflux protein